MQLDDNNHSVFLLYYHLFLVIKYRRNVLDDAVSLQAREIFVYLDSSFEMKLL